MKLRLSILLAAFTTAVSHAQLPAGSSITFAPGAAANTSRVTIVDPGDHVWTLQSSPDLSNWTDVQSYKVHNGRLDCTTAHVPSTTQLFYRTLYSTALQGTITSTLATAVNLPVSPYDYDNPTLPPAFAVPPISNQDNMPGTNITTDAGAKLGRILFYDKRLSLNQTISCSSCHQQAHGFSDPDQFSKGFEGGLTGRNSMGLTHSRWYQRRSFFWDERSATLEDQVLQPIQNAVEMGMTLPDLVTRLSAEPFYVDLFAQVFGTPGITSDRISRALAQFVRSIVAVQSRYDAALATGFALGANWTQSENRGRQLFNAPGSCSACHGTDNFVPGNNIFNNGLEFPYVDLGRGGITGQAGDNGKFKVGSLRNIELTAPYMHDGRFATLEKVVDFYSDQVVDNPNLSPPLRLPPQQGGGVRRPNFSDQDKTDLVNFMKSLTDPSLATNPKYSDPFNYGY
ncbi:MAG: cytochrome-c peroxidase [Verrucomicrobiaceae bacterium]|nr:cytochrome-c peroxidase [Verrucomicrobiaceae bacterium]